MLIKINTFCSRLKKIGPAVAVFLVALSIIGVIIVFSIYTSDAIYLRTWKSESNDYVPANLNMTVYQALIEALKLNTSTQFTSNNKSNAPVKINSRSYNVNLAIRYDDTDTSNSGKDNDNYSSDASFGDPNMSNEEEVICKPEPPKDDFSKCGNRIADRKCCEYIWQFKYKEELMERDRCLSDNTGVIGGTQAARGEFPHMAAVGFVHRKDKKRYSFMCGGSLISESYVLTAGHCTKIARNSNPDYEQEPYLVRLGAENIMTNTGFDFRIGRIIKHPKYKPPQSYYDIALLNLLRKVKFTYAIHPACLSTDLFLQIKTANITGWGVNDFHKGTRPDHLLMATVNIVNNDECQKIISDGGYYGRRLTKLRGNLLCAGSDTGTIDTCQGDSGGPLQTRIYNTSYGSLHRIYGVTSFGYKCARSGVPGIYVKVSAVISWIEKIVWPVNNTDIRRFGVI